MKIIQLIILALSINFSFGQNAIFFNKADDFFNENVKNGKVEYAEIKKNQSNLNDLTKAIADFDFEKESVAGQKAFLINAYNILVISGIVNKFPIKSPLDVSGFFDRIKYKVIGKKMTLNDIENKMIREKYKDPRFHFALVCGANGCPVIINKAYLPATIDAQLTNQTRIAVNNANFTKVSDEAKTVKLSQLFDWYKDDFLTKGDNYIDFLNKYRTDKIPDNYKVYLYNYDWTLNNTK